MMTSTQRGRRSGIAVLAMMATIGATVTLVPALAQQSAEARPEAYVELASGLTTQSRYLEFVDGDTTTSDPRQGFTGLAPLTLSGDPELVTIAAQADPHMVLANTGCLGEGGEPIGPLPAVTPAHYIEPIVAWIGPLPLIGVHSYTCAQNGPPQIVPETTRSFITPGETLEIARGADLPLDFRRLKLSIQAGDSTAVQVTAKLNGSAVGTIDVAMGAQCVNSSDYANADVLCATRTEPLLGALRQRYLNLDFGGPFDSFEMTATAGSFRIKGKTPSRFFLNGEVFAGNIGGSTGESSVIEPPTETLPGYEVTCADAIDPPPEGPCGGKEVLLTVTRFLEDLDEDPAVDQVLDVVPTGSVEDLALLKITIVWAPEDAPVGAVPLSSVDEDGNGPDDFDPAAWCSVDPPGSPGDQWCLARLTAENAGPGQIQVTDDYEGTGDPKFAR